MPLERDFQELMKDTVKIAPRTGQDMFGKATYGADVTYAPPTQGCYVEQDVKLVRNQTGQEVVSSCRVYMATIDQIAATSRVTLPAGIVPNQPPILDVQSLRDDKGAYATVLVLA